MSEMKSKELIDKYGSEVALIIVKEIIKEYDERICNSGYDHDYDMWDAQRFVYAPFEVRKWGIYVVVRMYRIIKN